MRQELVFIVMLSGETDVVNMLWHNTVVVRMARRENPKTVSRRANAITRWQSILRSTADKGTTLQRCEQLERKGEADNDTTPVLLRLGPDLIWEPLHSHHDNNSTQRATRIIHQSAQAGTYTAQ